MIRGLSFEERCNPKKIVLRVEVGKYEKSVLPAQGTVCEMHRGDRKSITLREPHIVWFYYLHQNISDRAFGDFFFLRF